jgi:hypothetical protein
VAECRFEGEPKRLELRLEHVPAEHFDCPFAKHGAEFMTPSKGRWRHLSLFQYRREQVTRVPRT